MKTITVSSPKACQAEVHKRISAVIDPYLENLDSKHEAGLIGIIREIRYHLINEFEDFMFETVDLTEPSNESTST